MEELIFLKNNVATVDSLSVAEKFGKRHDTVLRAIDNHRKNVAVKNRKLYREATYIDAKGETRRMYEMNRQGYELLVMGFNGDRALEWKLKYSDAFAAMEQFILKRQSADWQESRRRGKITRKDETGAIKELIEYATAQGSEHAEKFYINYSKLANTMAGIKKRDEATVVQLNRLEIFENIILHFIRVGMDEGMKYRDIYRMCKEECTRAKEVALLG